MGASSYGLLDAAHFNTVEGFLQPDGFLKNISRSRGGFQAAFPLYHMNRHQQQTRRKNQNRKQTLNKKNICKLNNQ
jgi:hypothetical protein